MMDEQVRALQRLSEPRRGLFATVEAGAIGIDGATLGYLGRRGWLRGIRRGVHAMAGAPSDRWEPLVAAVLAVGPDAVLSHWSAAAVHGFDGTLIGLPEVTVDRRSRRRLAGVIVHRSGPVPAEEVVIRRGIAVTSPVRTLIDLCATASTDRLGSLLDDGIVRRLWTPDDVRGGLDSQLRRRRGSAVLGPLLELRRDVGHSHLEQRVLPYLEPLRPFETQHQVVVNGRVYVVDAAWPLARVAAEIDGRTFRTLSRSEFERETRKMNDLGQANWLVAHLSAGMSPEACVAAVRGYLSMRGIILPG